MSNEAINTAVKVLHIRLEPSDSGLAQDMDALLAAASLRVDTCGDVYRALARLCRGGDEAPRAVIVCMDGLGTAELEFFSIVSRTRRGVGVYVYGGERSESRIARAIDLGATGRATQDVICTLTAEASLVASSAAEVEEPDTPPEEASPAPSVAPAGAPAEASGGGPSAVVAPAEHEAIDDADASSGPVRVPWLRYADAPARTAPQHRESDSGELDATGSVNLRAPSREPLLTEAELRALVGDDIAASTREQQDASEPEERQDGGRLS